MADDKKIPKLLNIKKIAIYSALGWTLLVLAFILIDKNQIQKEKLNRAYTYTKVGFDKDILYRSWVSSHGGVYVKVDSTTPPNPYLSHIPDRDVFIDSFLSFTLMNPAYMTRQVYELQEAETEVRGHITSLNSLRPENTPDPWERKALEAFENGTTEYFGIEFIEGEEYFRYMKPFMTEKSCLKCHAIQGYEVNDIRGGISVSYPMSHIRLLETHSNFAHLSLFGIVWIIGLVVIILSYKRINISENKRHIAENDLIDLNIELEEKIEIRSKELIKSQKDWENIFNTLGMPAQLIDKEHIIQFVNNETLLATNLKEKDLIGKKCYELLHLTKNPPESCPLSKSLLTKMPAKEDMMVEFLDKPFIVSCSPIYDTEGKIENFMHIMTDISDKEIALKSLEESQSQYKDLVEKAGIAVLIDDENGNFSYFNDKFRDLLGFSKKEMEKQSIKSVVHPDDLDKVLTNHKNHFTGEEFISRYEFRAIRKDGITIFLEIDVKPIEEQGKITGTQSYIWDITDRKNIENELTENQAFNEMLLNTSPDLIYIYDIIEGRNIYSNQGIVKILDYSIKEVQEMGQNLLPDLMHPDDFKAYLKIILPLYQSAKDGEIIEHEYRMKHKNGEWRWLHSKESIFKRQNNKSPKQIFGLTSDITERKLAEKNSAHSHDLMKYVIEHNKSAVAVHDKDMKYIYVSQRYLDDYKVKEKDVIGKHHYDVFPDLPQKWRDVHQKALQGEIFGAEDDPYYREDGSVDWTRWECRPWYEADGTIGGLIVYTEVITERKNAEEKVKESEANLKSLVENRDDSIWSVDSKLNFLTFNSFFAQNYLMAYNIELKKGLNAISILSTKLKKFWKLKYEDVLAGEKVVFEFSEEIGDKDFFFQVSLNPIITENKITGVSAISINITDRKNIEAELNKHKENLEDIVKKRTRELKDKNKDLERINTLFVGREIRMKELKEEINRLKGH